MATCLLPKNALLTISSAVANASRSPLLLLPPEIRCRIYEHLFSVTDIHIASDLPRSKHRAIKLPYRLLVCHCSQGYEGRPTVSLVPESSKNEPSYPDLHCACLSSKSREPICNHLRLDLLRVCRQIYHEAALKPFSQNTFVQEPDRAILEFLKVLVPTQARAIARLRIVGNDCPKQEAFKRGLKGLDHLEILVHNGCMYTTDRIARGALLGMLESFVKDTGVAALGSLRLKSFRITVEAACHSPEDARVHTASALEWLERTTSAGLQPTLE